MPRKTMPMQPASPDPASRIGLPLKGPSYPAVIRLLAALMVIGLVASAALSEAWQQLPSDMLLAAGLLGLVMLWQWAEVMGSVTEFDTDGLRHGLMVPRRIAWADITQARLIAWRGQEAWFSPRLVLQVRGQGRRVVRLGTRELLQAADAVLQVGGDQAASRSSPPM